MKYKKVTKTRQVTRQKWDASKQDYVTVTEVETYTENVPDTSSGYSSNDFGGDFGSE